MIHIESRNVDGLLVVHKFESVQQMLDNWNSDDTDMGDNTIQLVVRDGLVLFSSLGRKEGNYEDTMRPVDLIEWLVPGPYEYEERCSVPSKQKVSVKPNTRLASRRGKSARRKKRQRYGWRHSMSR